MPLTPDVVDRLADELYQAEQQAKVIPRVVERHPDLSFEDAFAIGQRVGDRYRVSGCRQVGWKLANSRVGTRAALSHPVKGPIFDRNLHSEADPLSLSGLIAPKIEPEICFLLDRDLAGPSVTVPQVLAATRGWLPAYEIVDARQDWDNDLRNIIADNVAHARLVVSDMLLPIGAIDLRYLGVVLERNGEVIGTGAGAIILGHPARAVAYLANDLATTGGALKAGELITTGSICTPTAMAAGDVFTATYGDLARISLRVGS